MTAQGDRSNSNSSVMNSDWQNVFKTNAESFLYMYKKGLYTDCTFIVGQGKEIQAFKAHKSVLVGVSPVFERMFCSEVKQNIDEIQVTDINPIVFDKFLCTIYSEKINLYKFSEACEMYYAATKYMVQRIADPCLSYIKQNITSENAAEAYEFLNLFGEKKAAINCRKTIISKTSDVINSEGFINIEKETLLMILNEDNLAVKSECELFDAAVRWVEAEIHRKGITGEMEKQALYSEILPSIRFLSMSSKEFARGPARSSVLSKEDTLAILLNLVDPTTPLNIPTTFSTQKRVLFSKKKKACLPENWKKLLQDAAKSGDVEELERLKDAGSDLRMRGNDGWSLLHWTAQKGHYGASQWLLNQGLNPNWTNVYGSVALHSAVYSGRLEIVELILDNGGDPSVQDEEGMTPLDLALELRHNVIAAFLRSRT